LRATCSCRFRPSVEIRTSPVRHTGLFTEPG
jgi:hypothetical protein